MFEAECVTPRLDQRPVVEFRFVLQQRGFIFLDLVNRDAMGFDKLIQEGIHPLVLSADEQYNLTVTNRFTKLMDPVLGKLRKILRGPDTEVVVCIGVASSGSRECRRVALEQRIIQWAVPEIRAALCREYDS